MLTRLLFASPLLAGILALGCANSPDSDELRGADASGGESAEANSTEGTGATAATGESATSRASAPQNELPLDQAGAGKAKLVAFQSETGGPAPAADDGSGEAGEVTPAIADQDIALLAKAIAELRASIEQLKTQNRQIMAALAIRDPSGGPELADPTGADPAGAEPPEGSLAYTVSDLRDTVEYLALEQEAMRKMLDQGTTVMKPVAPTHGKLIIENNTETDQQVWVNGTAHWVWAQTKATLSVPVGEVTTKLAGESAKMWEIKEPDYQEHIEFVRP